MRAVTLAMALLWHKGQRQTRHRMHLMCSSSGSGLHGCFSFAPMGHVQWWCRAAKSAVAVSLLMGEVYQCQCVAAASSIDHARVDPAAGSFASYTWGALGGLLDQHCLNVRSDAFTICMLRIVLFTWCGVWRQPCCSADTVCLMQRSGIPCCSSSDAPERWRVSIPMLPQHWCFHVVAAVSNASGFTYVASLCLACIVSCVCRGSMVTCSRGEA